MRVLDGAGPGCHFERAEVVLAQVCCDSLELGERAVNDVGEGRRVWRGAPKACEERVLLLCAGLGSTETKHHGTDERRLVAAALIATAVISGQLQMYPRVKLEA